MKTKFFNALSLAIIMAFLVTSLALADGTPTIWSDLPDYGPGDTVNLYSAGWQAGESVHVFVNDNVGSTWSRNVDVVAGSEGTFIDTFVLPNWFVATYSVTAIGAISGAANTMFTDGSLQVTGFSTTTGDFNFIVQLTGFSDGACTTNGGAPGNITFNNTTVLAVGNSIKDASNKNANSFLLHVVGTSSDGRTFLNWETNSTAADLCAVPPASSNVTKTAYFGAPPALVDNTPPVITPGVSGTLGNNGWYVSDVTVSWTVVDNESVISSTSDCDPTTINTDTAGTTLTCTATSAGGTSSEFVTIKRDTTAPTISGTASPSSNGAGWNNTDVMVSFTCGDNLSGVASCSPNQTLSSEGAGQSATGTAVDNAGNSASATVSDINIDKTAPTASASASPDPNVNGWNNTDVTVSFSGDDGTGSGIDFCDADVVLSSEGAGQSASGYCYDRAGNKSNQAEVTGINIDKTAPTVALVGGPADGGSYYFGFVPATPTCSATDALSGLDGACSVLDHDKGLGSHTVSASAIDKAGNSGDASATYTVLAWTLYGFYKPVDMTLEGGEIVWNTVKGGSTVPLKFDVFAGLTELTDTSFIAATFAKQVACASGTDDSVEVLATGGTSLRYDWTSGQFIYNWQTPKKPGQCYQLTMTTLDGSSLSAYFKLK